METLFFLASNTLGMIARVETWALILMALGLFGLWRGRRRLALVSFMILFTGTLALTFFALGDLLLRSLAAQRPARPDLPLVDGIIVPGGAGQTVAYRSWGGPQLNEAGERLTQGAMPALRGIWRLDRNLLGVNLALKEYLGTFAYRDFDK